MAAYHQDSQHDSYGYEYKSMDISEFRKRLYEKRDKIIANRSLPQTRNKSYGNWTTNEFDKDEDDISQRLRLSYKKMNGSTTTNSDYNNEQRRLRLKSSISLRSSINNPHIQIKNKNNNSIQDDEYDDYFEDNYESTPTINDIIPKPKPSKNSVLIKKALKRSKSALSIQKATKKKSPKTKTPKRSAISQRRKSIIDVNILKKSKKIKKKSILKRSKSTRSRSHIGSDEVVDDKYSIPKVNPPSSETPHGGIAGEYFQKEHDMYDQIQELIAELINQKEKNTRLKSAIKHTNVSDDIHPMKYLNDFQKLLKDYRTHIIMIHKLRSASIENKMLILRKQIIVNKWLRQHPTLTPGEPIQLLQKEIALLQRKDYSGRLEKLTTKVSKLKKSIAKQRRSSHAQFPSFQREYEIHKCQVQKINAEHEIETNQSLEAYMNVKMEYFEDGIQFSANVHTKIVKKYKRKVERSFFPTPIEEPNPKRHSLSNNVPKFSSISKRLSIDTTIVPTTEEYYSSTSTNFTATPGSNHITTSLTSPFRSNHMIARSPLMKSTNLDSIKRNSQDISSRKAIRSYSSMHSQAQNDFDRRFDYEEDDNYIIEDEEELDYHNNPQSRGNSKTPGLKPRFIYEEPFNLSKKRSRSTRRRTRDVLGVPKTSTTLPPSTSSSTSTTTTTTTVPSTTTPNTSALDSNLTYNHSQKFHELRKRRFSKRSPSKQTRFEKLMLQDYKTKYG